MKAVRIQIQHLIFRAKVLTSDPDNIKHQLVGDVLRRIFSNMNHSLVCRSGFLDRRGRDVNTPTWFVNYIIAKLMKGNESFFPLFSCIFLSSSLGTRALVARREDQAWRAEPMTKTDPIHVAHCQCGAVEVGAWAEPIVVSTCYCDDCQAAAERVAASATSAPTPSTDGGTEFMVFAGTASPVRGARTALRL